MKKTILFIFLFISNFFISSLNAQSNCPMRTTADLCVSQYSGGVSGGGNSNAAPTALTSVRYDPSGTGSFYVDIFNNLVTFTKDQCGNISPSNVNTFWVFLQCSQNSGPAITGGLKIYPASTNGALIPPQSTVNIISRQSATNLLVAPDNNQFIGNSVCTLQLQASYQAQDPCTLTCVTCGQYPIGNPVSVMTGPSSSSCDWFDIPCYSRNSSVWFSSFFYFIISLCITLFGIFLFVILMGKYRWRPYFRVHNMIAKRSITTAASQTNEKGDFVGNPNVYADYAQVTNPYLSSGSKSRKDKKGNYQLLTTREDISSEEESETDPSLKTSKKGSPGKHSIGPSTSSAPNYQNRQQNFETPKSSSSSSSSSSTKSSVPFYHPAVTNLFGQRLN